MFGHRSAIGLKRTFGPRRPTPIEFNRFKIKINYKGLRNFGAQDMTVWEALA